VVMAAIAAGFAHNRWVRKARANAAARHQLHLDHGRWPRSVKKACTAVNLAAFGGGALISGRACSHTSGSVEVRQGPWSMPRCATARRR